MTIVDEADGKWAVCPTCLGAGYLIKPATPEVPHDLPRRCWDCGGECVKKCTKPCAK